jgi:Delta3-Delta2-enoyl-CoA isomerase
MITSLNAWKMEKRQMEYLKIEKIGPVAVMIWQHEEQNRFTTAFLREILTSYDELEADDSVIGLVVTGGTGKFFSTGLYLEWMIEQGTKDPNLVGEFLGYLNQFLYRSTKFEKPLIAALNGHAAGAGAIVSACMDYRFGVQDKGFVRLPEVQINIPFWPGMTAIFKDILPAKTFRDMAYTGDRYTSAQAKEMGFIDDLFPMNDLVPKAAEFAARLGQAKKETYAAIKEGLRHNVLEIMKRDDPVAIKIFIENLKKSV